MSFFTLLGIATGDTALGYTMDRLLEKDNKPAPAPAVTPAPAYAGQAPHVAPATTRAQPPGNAERRERVTYRRSSNGGGFDAM